MRGNGGNADDEGSFFAASPDPIVEYEFVGGEPVIRAVNPAFEATFGCRGEAVVGDPLDEVVLPVGRDEGHDAVLRPGEAVEAELRCRTVEGVTVFLLRSTPLDGAGSGDGDDAAPGSLGESVEDDRDPDPDPNPDPEIDRERDGRRGYAVYTEISNHKRVEERFSALVNSSSDVLAILDRDGTIDYVSPSVEEVLDVTPDALEGEDALDWIHPDDREAVSGEFFEDPLEWTGETRSATYRFRDPAGGWRVVESVAKSRLHDPAVEGVVINCRDVTQRERREEELETFETIVKTVPVGVIVLDEEANVEWINERGASMVNMDPGDLEGLQFSELVRRGIVEEDIVEEYLAVTRELVSSRTDAEKKISEARIHPVDEADDRIIDIHFGLLPFEEEYQGTVNVFRDITERKRYERELEGKNTRLEEFASFVSHDLRNPLNVAQGYAVQARESGDPEAIEEVETSLSRMEQLIGELLTMAREGREADELEPVALASVAEAAWSTVDTADATLVVDADDDRRIEADEGLLRQLLENLFRNSVEHSSTGNRPEVTVRVGDLPGGFLVADDGPGIPTEERERVFELGYTTREEGTGFGLGIVDQVVEAHDWSVDVAESESGGARFEVTGVEPRE